MIVAIASFAFAVIGWLCISGTNQVKTLLNYRNHCLPIYLFSAQSQSNQTNGGRSCGGYHLFVLECSRIHSLWHRYGISWWTVLWLLVRLHLFVVLQDQRRI